MSSVANQCRVRQAGERSAAFTVTRSRCPHVRQSSRPFASIAMSAVASEDIERAVRHRQRLDLRRPGSAAPSPRWREQVTAVFGEHRGPPLAVHPPRVAGAIRSVAVRWPPKAVEPTCIDDRGRLQPMSMLSSLQARGRARRRVAFAALEGFLGDRALLVTSTLPWWARATIASSPERLRREPRSAVYGEALGELGVARAKTMVERCAAIRSAIRSSTAGQMLEVSVSGSQAMSSTGTTTSTPIVLSAGGWTIATAAAKARNVATSSTGRTVADSPRSAAPV